jgi:hypothetical protein
MKTKKRLNNDLIRKDIGEAIMEMMVWMYGLGQCQKDIERCRRKLEILLNAPDFDENNHKDKLILNVYNILQFLEINIEP